MVSLHGKNHWMLTFNKNFFLVALLLFIAEVLIALFVRDDFVRPYVGDFLVVILLYCAIRTFLNASTLSVSLMVLLFAYTLEILQYFHLIDLLRLGDSLIARTIIGYGFAWLDLLAYTLGIATVLATTTLQRKLECRH